MFVLLEDHLLLAREVMEMEMFVIWLWKQLKWKIYAKYSLIMYFTSPFFPIYILINYFNGSIPIFLIY